MRVNARCGYVASGYFELDETEPAFISSQPPFLASPLLHQCMHNNLRQNGWLKFRLRCGTPSSMAGSFTISGTAIRSLIGF
jgi:hypothetical protein